MIMWVMSDRAIPRSFRMMEGFGVHTFRLVNAQGRVALREVPLEARCSACTPSLWDEAHEDLRQGSRTSTGATSGRRSSSGNFPEWELGVQVVEEKDEHDVRLRPARPDQDHARGAGAGAARRPADPQPQPGQLLRRDRAGRVPSRPRRARHRLHRTTRCCRGGSSPTPTPSSSGSAGPNFHEIPINRPVAPVHNNQRDGLMRQTINAAAPPTSRTRSAAAARCRRARRAAASSRYPGAASTRRRSGSAARSSSTTSARRRSSGTASPIRSRTTSSRRCASSSARSSGRRSASGWSACSRSWTTRPRDPRRRGAGLRSPAQPGRPAQPEHPRRRRPEGVSAARARKALARRRRRSAWPNTVKDTVKTRKVAILAADGVDEGAVAAMSRLLTAAGAVPKIDRARGSARSRARGAAR